MFGTDGMTPVPLALVELRSQDGLTLVSTTTADSAGFYRFADALPPGQTLTVRALFPDDTTLQAEVQVTAAEALEVVRADLTLSGVTVIKGFLFDADGLTPLAGTDVFLTPFGTIDEFVTTTDGTGFRGRRRAATARRGDASSVRWRR